MVGQVVDEKATLRSFESTAHSSSLSHPITLVEDNDVTVSVFAALFQCSVPYKKAPVM